MNKKLILILTCSAMLTACASSGRYIPRHASHTNVSIGSVLATEEITIGGTNTGIGSYVGSAAAIHDSTSHSFLGIVARGLAGAIVGAAAEELLTRRTGMLYTVETTRGALIEVSSKDKSMTVGDCVQVSHAGMRHVEIKPSSTTACIPLKHKKRISL